MAKRKRNNSTQEKIERWLKEGRGQGEGKNYKPWLNIQDVASIGYSTRDLGWKTGRIHHFLSDLELNYMYTLDWSPYVVDIREQFPLLPLERTIEIADELGIEHPREDGKKGPYKVITTDFLIVVKTKNGLEKYIRTIKPVNNLTVRELEKFDIERKYFQDMGITNWKIVTDKDIPKNFGKNIEWLYDCKTLMNRPNLDIQLINTLTPTLYKALKNENIGLSKLALKYDEIFGLDQGSCLFIIKYLLANKIWLTDMNKEIKPSERLDVFVNEEEINKSDWGA